jgi:hypothetical protein
MFPRGLARAVAEALADRPVVLVNGARQTGKTTLARHLAATVHPARYVTLDDASVLAAAHGDPAGFVSGLQEPVILDEVQRVPELFPAIKAAVDRDRTAGRFLLTGSADVLLLPRLSESLAGRMEVHTLWPLSQGELEGQPEELVDALFADSLPAPRSPQGGRKPELVDRLVRGGYPEVVGIAADARRQAWFGSYVTTILQRDVRDLANIEGLTMLPRLLRLLASRSTALLNFADLSRSIGIPQTTLKRYMALLEMTFLLQTLPAWFVNIGKRLVKSPKLLLNDTGLAAHLQGLNAERLVGDRVLLGPLLENFVVMELKKQAGWSRRQPQLHHFRTEAGEEVDVVLEDAAGGVVGIEVKAAATVAQMDFKGLRTLAAAAGKRFHRGVVLHTGPEVIPFAADLHALPISTLWRTAAGRSGGPGKPNR